MGQPGIDTLLVASQVVLAIVLPFVAAPLIWLTSSKSVMSVRKPTAAMESIQTASQDVSPTVPTPPVLDILPDAIEEVQTPTEPSVVDSRLDEKCHVTIVQHRVHDQEEEMSLDEDAYVSFASGWVVTSLAYLIFFIILAANVYAIVMLALGRTT